MTTEVKYVMLGVLAGLTVYLTKKYVLRGA